MKSIMIIKECLFRERKIPELLEKIGCHHIKQEQSGKLFTAGLPDGDNTRSVQIRNNVYLGAHIRSRGISKIDVIGIVAYVLFREQNSTLSPEENIRKHIREAIKWIEENFNIRDDFDDGKVSILDLDWVKEARGIKIKENKPLNQETALSSYIQEPSFEWIREGIDYDTQKRFNICFNSCDNQIIIPIYDYTGKIIGTKARNQNMHKYTSKYIYDKPCNASLNLYGLHIAKDYIDKRKAIIVFEAEKSVMKGYQYGFPICVALGCKDITITQVHLIRKFWNKDIRIFIALDKDVYFHNGRYDFFHFEDMAKMFPENIRENIYYLIDTKKILGEKDAPVDKGKDVFITILKHSVPYKKVLEINTKLRKTWEEEEKEE